MIEHIEELVAKEVHGSGGYGLLVGPTSSKREISRFLKKLKARPGNYIAQPTLALSTVPILTSEKGWRRAMSTCAPSLSSRLKRIRISPGGLTRVALKKGSLVVNSSQGGGTKDTWVLEE